MSGQMPDPERIEQLLLGGPLLYTRSDIQQLSGVAGEFANRLWRAFGYPSIGDDTIAFTEGDMAALLRIKRLVEDGVLDQDSVIQMARAVGQTMARLAEWQVDLMIAKMAADAAESTGEDSVKLIVEAAEKHIDEFEPLIVHAWRRQLAASGTRAVAMASAQEAEAGSRGKTAVGFADMVSFTQMSRQLEEIELARVVERFETTTSDVIAANGGRLVKTLGDEVLFCAESAELGAEIALCVAESIKDETEVPDVRVGLAYGPVLPLMGDVFGTTVNLAARLTSIARPGTVVVDTGMAAELEESKRYEATRIVRRPARGLGIIQPYVLRRREEHHPSPPGEQRQRPDLLTLGSQTPAPESATESQKPR